MRTPMLRDPEMWSQAHTCMFAGPKEDKINWLQTQYVLKISCISKKKNVCRGA